MTRDQNRALHAYERVRALPKGMFDDYKIAVNGLGPNVLRSGLAGAMAFLERDKSNDAIGQLLSDLSAAGIPGFKGEGSMLPDRVRKLDLPAYMLATRELLNVILWFKRAVQANEDKHARRAD